MDNNSFEHDVDGGGQKSPLADSTSIDITRDKQIADKPYAGMGKEDLLRFSQTPFWNNLRLTCLIIFWAAWVGLLTAVVALTVVAPRCAAPPEQTWWQRTVIYQVYVRSFYDTDGNGVGDLQGVTSKLDYIKSLNAETVVLSAFYPSHYSEPDRTSNMGYDITDHIAVDPDYGTMDDFDALLDAAHEKDMKVVIDFVPNHTGDKHQWFVESQSNADPTTNPYWNYYVWNDCGTLPNWLSVYGESAWVDASTGPRTQCYLNQFLTEKNAGADATAGYQPDLNLRSSAVRAELESILRFWLERGVDGFRVMDSKFLFEDADLNDEGILCGETSDYNCRDHSRTTNQAETYEIISSWRVVLEEYSTQQEKILITDARDSINNTVRYYGLGGTSGSHLPLNYQLLDIIPGNSTGTEVQALLDDYLDSLPQAATADWLTGYQDASRVGSRVSEAFSRSLAILKMTLPGPPLIYYGEELNMVDGTVFTATDPSGLERDNYRTLMQWDRSDNGGFQNISAGGNGTGSDSPWVPVNDDYLTKNVELLDEDESSILNIYRLLAELRMTEDGLAYGLMEYAAVDADVFSFVRQFDGTSRFLVAVNFGAATASFDLTSGEADVPGSAELVVASTTDGKVNERSAGDNVDLKRVSLGSGEGAVFRWAFSR